VSNGKSMYEFVPVGNFLRDDVESVDPRQSPKEVFDLWSIPAHDNGTPEIVTGAEVGSHKKLVKSGDVLLSKIVPHIQRSRVVDKSDANRRIIASTEWIVFSGELIHARFLREVLTSEFFHRRFMETITGVGGSLARANPKAVSRIKIPLPPLAEQRKIAEILRTWDEAIETAEAELRAKQDLLKRAVAKYFEKSYRDAASGKAGKLKTLDAVCTRKGEYGAAVSACPYNPEWPRYIRITDITETGILKKERAVSISPESAEGYNLKMGDLLFARTGEPGRCLIFNEEYPAAFAGYLIRFKARPEVILPEYVYFYTLSSVYDKWVGDVSQKGAQANINAKVYGSLQLPVTDLNSQEAAVRVFKALQESVLLAEQGAELLRTQKRGLMQKLLTGEVRVAA
jgi:hypothetical protein